MFSHRIATKNELHIVRCLAAKIWSSTYKDILPKEQLDYMYEMMYSIESLNDQMCSRGDTFFIFTWQGEDVGYVSIETVSESVYVFQKIYLLPDIHGKGVGRKMVDVAINYLNDEASGEFVVRLFVNRSNPAVSFYSKLGFVIKEERDFHVGRGYYMNDYIMEISDTYCL